jgi:hypothetical protein
VLSPTQGDPALKSTSMTRGPLVLRHAELPELGRRADPNKHAISKDKGHEERGDITSEFSMLIS